MQSRMCTPYVQRVPVCYKYAIHTQSMQAAYASNCRGRAMARQLYSVQPATPPPAQAPPRVATLLPCAFYSFPIANRTSNTSSYSSCALQVVRNADVIFVAVKPQYVATVLQEARPVLGAARALVPLRGVACFASGIATCIAVVTVLRRATLCLKSQVPLVQFCGACRPLFVAMALLTLFITPPALFQAPS